MFSSGWLECEWTSNLWLASKRRNVCSSFTKFQQRAQKIKNKLICFTSVSRKTVCVGGSAEEEDETSAGRSGRREYAHDEPLFGEDFGAGTQLEHGSFCAVLETTAGGEVEGGRRQVKRGRSSPAAEKFKNGNVCGEEEASCRQ